jgi:hypothetical protein
MGRATREEWAARVTRWKDSGLTAVEFGSETGVNPRSLMWWKWRLAAKARASRSPKPALAWRGAEARTKASATTISPLTFVEMSGPIEGEALEVVLPSRVQIRVRPGFDVTTLGRLLDVLEARR